MHRRAYYCFLWYLYRLRLPRDKRSNKSDSSNYRASAISIIVSKLLNSIIIQDQHVSLKTDDL